MSGLAGMGMATCYVAAEKRVRTLDFVTRCRPISRRPVHRPRGARARPVAAGTPGNLAGWCELVRAYGRKTLAEIFAPAIALARDGFPLTEFNVSAINDMAAEFSAHPRSTTTGRTTTPAAASVPPGDVLRQPELARTSRRSRPKGPAYLYGGALGKAIVAHLQTLGGCLTLEDLEAVEAAWLDPLARAIAASTSTPCRRRARASSICSPCASSRASTSPRWSATGRASRYGAARHPPRRRRCASPTTIRRPSSCRAAVGRPRRELRARVRDGKPIDGPTEQWMPPPRRARCKAHHLVLDCRPRRQRRVRHPEPRRAVRLRRRRARHTASA